MLCLLLCWKGQFENMGFMRDKMQKLLTPTTSIQMYLVNQNLQGISSKLVYLQKLHT